jgi:hypothetical protein
VKHMANRHGRDMDSRFRLLCPPQGHIVTIQPTQGHRLISPKKRWYLDWLGWLLYKALFALGYDICTTCNTWRSP